MADHPVAGQLLEALQQRFARRWRVGRHGVELVMRPRRSVSGMPRQQLPSSRAIVDVMQRTFADHGVERAQLLPIRWSRDTELLISAIRGLDPWLKDGVDRVWREGFLPQPVVRFTGERDEQDRLREGFLTSFVNLSCVRRVAGVDRHVELLDVWLDALSAVGVHAGRVCIAGSLEVWQRATVSGITLHMSCDGIGFADAVLLWHTADPACMATDVGSGLERLRWLLSPVSWAETVFGADAAWFDPDTLDAVRTATLLVMAGLGRGDAGGALRRVARRIPVTMAASGMGRLVRTQRLYWSEVNMRGPPWAHVADTIEATVLSGQASDPVP